VQGLDTPEKRRKLFPTVDQVSPFAEADIHVINRIPFDPRFLRKAVVDLGYSGPAGVPESRSFTFDGTTDVQRFTIFSPATSAEFQLTARVTTTQASASSGGWPVIRKGAFLPVRGTVVEINRAAIGMDFVHVEADPGVFTRAALITVTLFLTAPGSDSSAESSPQSLVEVSLTATQPAAWVALPGVDPATDLFARVVAHSAGDSAALTYTVCCGHVVDRDVRVAEYQLEVLNPDVVSVQLDPQIAGRFALVQVTVAPFSGDGRTYTLRPGEPVIWNLFRNNVFETLRYRYRLDYMALDAEGRSLPMVGTDWTAVQDTTTLIIRPPLDRPVAQP
jgi:hypothetical protein